MSTGVKQDSIEGPTLWNIFYTFLLLDWVKRYKEELGDSGGVSFEYSLDGALWTGENNAKRGSHTSNINDLEYEDDLVVFETDPAQKQNRCMYLRHLPTIASFPIFSFAQRRWNECTNFCIWAVSSEIAMHCNFLKMYTYKY